MRLLAALLILFAAPAASLVPAARAQGPFVVEEAMIPMRDGVKLHTVILRPRDQKGPLPILFSRTPYGASADAPARMPRSWAALARDGYIFVQQDMRGRFGSEGGPFTLSTEIKTGKKAVDESTDAWDSIDWLVKKVKPNNGRVGMWGVSYPGLAAAIALARPHPALKAVSPQAAWTDYFMNDDLHRWGAMRLTYATDWLTILQWQKDANVDFAYDGIDTYDFFLKAGSPAELEAAYIKGRLPRFTEMIEHPDYDDFWKRQRWSDKLGRTTVPTLNVAGYYDQEDPWGSWQIYYKQQQDDPGNLSQIVAGPWNHGGWRGSLSSLGRIPYGVDSGTSFREEVEAPFFAYWLHGKGARPDYEVKSFQSGSWTWKTYAKWPLPQAHAERLTLRANGSLTFGAPAGLEGCREFVSDPANPVPFRPRPISPTYPRPEWQWWEAEDQRFVDGRPDVLTWVGDPLTEDLTVTGAIAARLMASTSGTDSDFIVKLIDVFPDGYTRDVEDALGGYTRQLNGYQLPVAMEVRRGRYLEGFEVSRPLVPNKVVAWDVPLRDHDHVFRKGHRIMVQVQSSWFPVIDRNPQTFVPNIYKAQRGDYVKATQRVCDGSYVELPVVR
ncbi:CocE/NonD family hydrolase [Sphingomonas canadensis]|uniref:CocE/NonD family hydrolase n=1 Tax=Sphingomonas canadensis TaxID=1219257 RepID=A0ABW3H2H4_9SPHN|nr:CocE/NonD family hydrolase [Sphingomonas canadensis]MCW3835184.1 CocE/NonD family hydrolase [Sphingomonas canadensis]